MERALRTEIFDLHAQICQGLSDPKRLLILNELRGVERTGGELAASLDLRQANVSQHLAVLRQRGLVVARRDGNLIYYRIADPRLLEALDLLREVLAQQLRRSRELAHDIDLDASLGARELTHDV